MSFKQRVFNRLTEGCWNLGFIEEPLEGIIAGESIVIHYLHHRFKDRWFADPWLLDVDDKVIKVLVEEYKYRERCGYISLLTIDRSQYSLISTKTLLKLPTHLSFPAILRKDDKVYIYPENAAGEGLGLYELGNDTCIHVWNISKEPLADAVITNCFGDNLLFSTHVPTHNGNILTVYKIELFKGEPELETEVAFTSNVARNAGNWLRIGNKVYRPAQDCNGRYGSAVILQEVEKEENRYVFKDIRRITSTNPKLSTGLHTFNHLNGLTVVDVHGYHHSKIIARLVLSLFDYYVKLFK